MNLTKRQKFIASCAVPTYGGYATKKEVKWVKLLARGHYWDEPEWYNFVSYNPKGIRKFFDYEFYSWAKSKQKKEWKKLARKAAYYWARGEYKKANEIDEELWKSG